MNMYICLFFCLIENFILIKTWDAIDYGNIDTNFVYEIDSFWAVFITFFITGQAYEIYEWKNILVSYKVTDLLAVNKVAN